MPCEIYLYSLVSQGQIILMYIRKCKFISWLCGFLEADLHVFINEGYERMSTSLKRVGSVAEVSFLQETCLPLSV